MESCIYEGRVKHTRSKPAKHEFSYRLFLIIWISMSCRLYSRSVGSGPRRDRLSQGFGAKIILVRKTSL